MKRLLGPTLLTTLLALIGATSASQAWACGAHPEDGFLPKNNQRIPVRTKIKMRNGRPVILGITESEFNSVLDAVEKTYAPIVAQKGGRLVVNRLWTDAQVNASAERKGANRVINMYGGLARHPEARPDGFLLVACHELGHHLGENPKYNDGPGSLSAEGQADYFATLKCARRVLEKQDNVGIVARMKVPAGLRAKCEDSFRSANDAAICQRTSMGALSLGRLLASFTGPVPESQMPLFSTPDRSRVPQTIAGYPSDQCRLDTYVAGATCIKDAGEELSPLDNSIGTCSEEAGMTEGVRPRCWYAPGSGAPRSRRLAHSESRRIPRGIRR